MHSSELCILNLRGVKNKMGKLVECVPNFSEGRRPEVIEAIVEEVKKVKG